MPQALIPVDPQRFALLATAVLGGGLWLAARRPQRVIDHPRVVLALLLAVTAAACAVLVRLDPPGLRLAIDPSTEPLLPAGDPSYDAYRRAVRDFGDDQVYVIAMECDDVFTAENLRALRRVGDRISRLDGVRRVDSLARVTYFRWDPERELIEVRPFVEDIPDDPASLAALRRQALADPLYRKTLVSADGRAAALDVAFRDLTDRQFIDADLDGAIRRVLDSESGPTRHFWVSGRPHIKSRMYHVMARDLAVLIPVALSVVAGLLLAIAGSVRSVVLALATVGTAVVWTFAAIALLGRPLTVLTVLLAPTLLAVGSVYGVHVVGRFEEESAEAGDPREAARRALGAMIVPVLIAGLTTVVGFGALLITNVPAVFEIGAFSVLGVASVTLVSLTGIPAALVLLPPLHRPRGGIALARRRLALRAEAWLDRGLLLLARSACRRPQWVIGGWAVAVALAVAAIPHIEIDTDYLSFFDPRDPVRVDFERIDRLLAGAVPIYVVLSGSKPGLLRDPPVLHAVEDVQRRIEAQPGVSRTLSFLDTMRAVNRALAGGDPAEERIPDSRAAITELFFLLPKDVVHRFVTVDQSSANLVVRTGTVGSAALRDLTARIRAQLDGALPESLSARITGNAILLTRAADGVAEGQPRTVGIAAAAIFVLLAIGLRSVGLGLVAMIPNVVPVLLFYGALGAGAASLSLPTSLIGSVALGIAIDSTAHYLVRYRVERASGRSPEQAVMHCNRRVGRPVAIAAAVLVFGFLSVTASEFANLREFGYLTAATMVVCCAADLWLLPALLVRGRV
jgi:uncharacterized protein